MAFVKLLFNKGQTIMLDVLIAYIFVNPFAGLGNRLCPHLRQNRVPAHCVPTASINKHLNLLNLIFGHSCVHSAILGYLLFIEFKNNKKEDPCKQEPSNKLLIKINGYEIV
jgi:hypothetical protein